MKHLPVLALLCCSGTSVFGQEIGRLHLRSDDSNPDASTVVIDLTARDVPSPASFDEILGTHPAVADDGESGKPVKVSPAIGRPILQSGEQEPGLAIRISGFSGDAAKLNPEKVSLKAPFPAKALGSIPDGWKVVRADGEVPIFESEAEIAPGSGIELKLRPHILVPAADGSRIFSVPEPGYEAVLEYRQSSTIGALLGDSVRRLEHDEERMSKAIDHLEQLLISLPNHDTEP